MPNYRQIYEDSLRESRPDQYEELVKMGELKAYLDDVQQDANQLHRQVVKDLRERHLYNPAEWGSSREAWEGWLERTAQEIVLNDRVLVMDEETEKAMQDGYTDYGASACVRNHCAE